jgi:hypothetical protein
MKFVFMDGRVISGRSYTDIVKKMSELKFVRARSLARYRRATARRVADLFGVDVNVEDDRSFVQSLEAGSLLERVQ